MNIFESVFFEIGEISLGDLIRLLFDSTVCHMSESESDSDISPIESFFAFDNFKGGIVFLGNDLPVVAIMSTGINIAVRNDCDSR